MTDATYREILARFQCDRIAPIRGTGGSWVIMIEDRPGVETPYLTLAGGVTRTEAESAVAHLAQYWPAAGGRKLRLIPSI